MVEKIIESLSQNERRIIPYLKEKNVEEISKKSKLDKTSVLRALDYLENKKVIKLDYNKKKKIEAGINGALYKKKGLPERRLLNLLNEKRIIPLEEAQKESNLSEEEFKASIGALKRKAMVDLKNGKLILNSSKEEISKKFPEEKFLELLPLEYESLNPEQKYALASLERRKEIVSIKDVKEIKIEITEIGKKLANHKISEQNLIEVITPNMLKKDSLWKGKKFRRYDMVSIVPEISGGKRHFVNQSMDYARKIWTEMGFKEMTGNMVISSFWNFDALFTPQDHPVREMQDTFFINKSSELSNKKIIEKVRKSHETGVAGSKGWQYKWNEEIAKKMLLRTHTTCLSSQTLTKIKPENLPAKFFAVGRCFRNETMDWSHGFEFNQTEGIVIDPDANFRHLLGYLTQFYKKMGFEKIRVRPSFFPYTEPSLEIDAWQPEKKIWLEIGGAGIFRPEVTEPLLGKAIPVLAWGPGFDRMIMNIFGIKDMREVYKNDLTQLRKLKFLVK
jgi:phenylalanyl-tRNA synthetase alpha chain